MSYFDEVVAQLKEEGFRSPAKYKFKLEDDSCLDPILTSNRRYQLDDSTELQRPEFWVPISFDGYRWQVHPCLPPWISEESLPSAQTRYLDLGDDQLSKNEAWLLSWIARLEDHYSPEVSEDSEEFLLGELSLSDQLAQDDSGEQESTSVTESKIFFDKAAELLRQATLGISPTGPHERPLQRRLEHGECVLRNESVWAALEAAFLAGRNMERACAFKREIPDSSLHGKVFKDRQGSKSAEPRKEWTKRVWEILSENISLKPQEIRRQLHDEGLIFTMDGWRTVSFEDEEEPDKSAASFSTAVGRVRNSVKKAEK